MLTDPFGTNQITKAIVGCAIRVHDTVGPGLFENIYSEGIVVAELKSVAALIAIHQKQLLSQLRLTNLPVGLLLNFNVEVLTDGGVKRIINSRYKPAVTVAEPDGDELLI